MAYTRSLLGVALLTGMVIVWGSLTKDSGAAAFQFILIPSATAPGVATNFNAQFTAPVNMLGSSRVTFTFDSRFSIPSGFGAPDVDLVIAGMSQNLSASAGDLISGVLQSGRAIQITLGSFVAVNSGASVEIRLRRITNPSATGTYGVSVQISSSTGTPIAAQATNLVIVSPIAVTATVGAPVLISELVPGAPVAPVAATAPTVPPQAGGIHPQLLAPAPAQPVAQPVAPGEPSLTFPSQAFHPVDIDRSRRIDVSDFALMLTGWRTGEVRKSEQIIPVPGRPVEIPQELPLGRGDLNQDGKLTLQDISIFLFYWRGP